LKERRTLLTGRYPMLLELRELRELRELLEPPAAWKITFVAASS
jgi:hypothetical protein